jgi:copper chaperone CopZ
LIAVLINTSCGAQIKNEKTETVKVYGNCDMCKNTIEKAGNLKKVAKVVWNKENKLATLNFDSKKTNEDQILKRIALAGYDNDKFFAPDDAYAKLPECCKYQRNKKSIVKADTTKNGDHHTFISQTISVSSLKNVFDNYFSLKDALVKTDANAASAKAKDLLVSINSIKMETLKMDEHMIWMKVMKDLASEAEQISLTKDLEKQRITFNSLSNNIYELAKVSKQPETIYYQHCPMYNDGKGADWLSKESTIKNPYYGSQMMTCGKTVETIK